MTNKRNIIITAFALLSAACTPQGAETPPVQEAVSLRPLSTNMTKGYVEGTQMFDTPYDKLHGTPEHYPRTISVTAWLYPQKGTETEYFRDAYFWQNANGEDDGLWHHNPRVYWPFGGRLDFLAYSSRIPFPEPSVKWGYGRSTDKLELTVDRRYTQDDIMFSCALSKKHADSDPSVPMIFDHAQAWLEFRMHSSSAQTAGIVTLERIDIEDIYTAGALEVTHPFSVAEAAWDFKFTDRKDTPVDDTYAVYGTTMDAGVKYLDMLIPEQLMKDFILHYRLPGSDVVFKYRYDLPNMTWLMGHKYIYDITFSPHKIEITPTVEEWTREEREIEIPER